MEGLAAARRPSWSRLVAMAGIAMTTILSSTAVAQAPSWGEIVFQRAGTSGPEARYGGYYDAGSATYESWRLGYKSGTWDWSHTQGAGVTTSVFTGVIGAAHESQTTFDLEASAAFGVWYTAKTGPTRSLLRDVVRHASGTIFVVELDTAGFSSPASLTDWTTLKAAADAADRPSFDLAAEGAWGSWFLGLSDLESDLVYAIVIDHPGAG